MAAGLEQLLEQYDQGVVSRRQLLKGLALLASAGSFVADAEAAAAQTPVRAIAPVISINHVHIEVSDMKRSADFYESLLGATPREAGPGIMTMGLPNRTNKMGSWLSLVDGTFGQGRGRGPGGGGGKPGSYNHVGFGVHLDAPRIVADLKRRWPEVKTAEPNRTDQLYVYDPDGLPFQLMTPEHDGYIASEKVPDGKGGMKNVMKYKPGEHLNP
jgi:catechol 2,3-dioxygenase-like lactoylglutathione lyase family enzyme